MSRPTDQRGAATSAAVVVLAVLVVITVLLVSVGRALVDRRRAASAADLAALSGATALQRRQPACPQARRLAKANGAVLVSCRVEGQEIWVETEVESPLPWRTVTVQGQAHAGPAGR